MSIACAPAIFLLCNLMGLKSGSGSFACLPAIFTDVQQNCCEEIVFVFQCVIERMIL